jgi:hypothetical protein
MPVTVAGGEHPYTLDIGGGQAFPWWARPAFAVVEGGAHLIVVTAGRSSWMMTTGAFWVPKALLNG